MGARSDIAGRRRGSGPGTTAVDPLLSLDDFPIPANTPAGGKGWSPFMIEMAQHIGAHATLLLIDRFGGREVYVPIDASRSQYRDLLGEQAARKLHRVYCRERLTIPTARTALEVARRASVIAMVRAGVISLSVAARIVGFRRDSMSRLVNRSDEGKGIEAGRLPVRRQVRFAARAGEIAAAQLARAGASPAAIEATRAAIMELAL